LPNPGEHAAQDDAYRSALSMLMFYITRDPATTA